MDKRLEEIRRLSRKGPIDLERGSLEGGLPRVAVESAGAVTATHGRVNCPVCDEDISARAKKCRHCGETLDPEMREFEARHRYAERPVEGQKNKFVAALLALFLGGLGAHKFYLGRPGQGILYILFLITTIPIWLSLFEGVRYLLMDNKDFWKKYG